MVTLEDFLENAQVEGICDEYRDDVVNCGSKKQLMDIALSAKGSDYLCDAIAKGWGASPQEISKRFAPYINGKYTLDKGYTSTMYCQYNGSIVCETTLLTLIECNIEVEIPEYHVCEIYACGKCNISVTGKGQVLVVTYGNPNDVVLRPDMDIRCKRLRKKERDGN